MINSQYIVDVPSITVCKLNQLNVVSVGSKEKQHTLSYTDLQLVIGVDVGVLTTGSISLPEVVTENQLFRS